MARSMKTARESAPTGGGEADAGAPTPEPRGGESTKHFYYMERTRTGPVGVFVSDHSSDCDSLYREACEEEVLALTGREMLRVAQDVCAWNGLGSTYLVAYEGAVFEPVMVGSGRRRRAEHRLVGHRETGPVKRSSSPPARAP